VTAGDARAWAAAVHELASDEVTRARMREAGLRLAEAHGYSRCAAETLSILREWPVARADPAARGFGRPCHGAILPPSARSRRPISAAQESRLRMLRQVNAPRSSSTSGQATSSGACSAAWPGRSACSARAARRAAARDPDRQVRCMGDAVLVVPSLRRCARRFPARGSPLLCTPRTLPIFQDCEYSTTCRSSS